jgi:hypothetical protein
MDPANVPLPAQVPDQDAEVEAVLTDLKKVKLEDFSGDAAKDGSPWTEWRNQPESVLGSHELLERFKQSLIDPAAPRLHPRIGNKLFWMIKQHLKGAALQAISDVADGDFYALWNTLNDQYQPKRRVHKAAKIRALIDPVNKPDGPADVERFMNEQRDVYVQLEEIIRSSKQPITAYQLFLLGIQINLPPELSAISDIISQRDDIPWGEVKASLLDKCDQLADGGKSSKAGGKEATVLYTHGGSSSSKVTSPPCHWCGKNNHWSATCRHRPGATPASAPQRTPQNTNNSGGGGKGKGKGKGKKGLCNNCMKPGHYANECRSPTAPEVLAKRAAKAKAQA